MIRTLKSTVGRIANKCGSVLSEISGSWLNFSAEMSSAWLKLMDDVVKQWC